MKYRIFETSYKFEKDNDLLNILDSLSYDLTTNLEIRNSKQKLIKYINQIDTTRIEYENEKDIYKDVFDLQENLKRKTNTTIEDLIYVNRLLDVITIEESNSIIYHPKYQIQPFYNDTVYLKTNSKIELPAAIYFEYEGDSTSPNLIEHNINYEPKTIEFNTYGKVVGETYSQYSTLKVKNVVTGENYTIKDSIYIKVID